MDKIKKYGMSADLPNAQNLERGVEYWLKDRGSIVVDHGDGPVEYGAVRTPEKFSITLTQQNIDDGHFDLGFNANSDMKDKAYINIPGYLPQIADADFSIENDDTGECRRVRFIPPFVFDAGMRIDCFVWR